MSDLSKRIAIADLGTNTFHILVVDILGSTFSEVYRERVYVKLGENGLESIGPEPYKRGINTIAHFQSVLKNHNCTSYTFYGTAALRRAGNGTKWIEEVKDLFDIEVILIDGDKEAELIFEGTRLAIDMTYPSLIMDIGGGSVEFIAVESNLIKWKRSLKIGIALLKNQYITTDPISNLELADLRSHIQASIAVLPKSTKPRILIGSAGSFEVLGSMMGSLDEEENEVVDMLQFREFCSTVIMQDYHQRESTEGIPMSRADLIHIAAILMEEVIQYFDIQQIAVSPYALKEGAICKYLD